MHVWEWALGWIIGDKKVIDKSGLQYRLEENHLHHRMIENHLQYRLTEERLHHKIFENHLHYRHDGEPLHYRALEEE